MAASWHSNKFLNLVHDGAVLPILHLNGYKIANPALLSRIDFGELRSLFVGYGYDPLFVEVSISREAHRDMAAALDDALDRIKDIQNRARSGQNGSRPRWPMIILRSPKGWTGPKEVDGKKTEGSWRSHQIPITDPRTSLGHLALLEHWLRSYEPETLFDDEGRLRTELQALAPVGQRRMGANPQANGGLLKQDLLLPDIRSYAVETFRPGAVDAEATRVMGTYLRDVTTLNSDARNFRIMGPDETASNRLDAVFEATERVWMERIEPCDVHLDRDGRVMEVLSEHLCQGWLEGYVLTGRHGLMSCYEAFIHIVGSMVNQHDKWLKVSRGLPWRKPIASLNYLLTSHVWRQDHNGFSHQDPGFVDMVANKKADIVRVYFPPDANTLLWITDHCLRTHDRINVIVAGKQPAPQWLTMREAVTHCEAGLGIWHWAGIEDPGCEPDIVMACCGDVPTLETLAAVDLLRSDFPQLRIRVVNVVDLRSLQDQAQHPHGLNDDDYDSIFTRTRPIMFAYHGYPVLIHRLTYKRSNHDKLHVQGFREEGTTTTPFDIAVMNGIDRFHLASKAITALPFLAATAERTLQKLEGWAACMLRRL